MHTFAFGFRTGESEPFSVDGFCLVPGFASIRANGDRRQLATDNGY